MTVTSVSGRCSAAELNPTGDVAKGNAKAVGQFQAIDQIVNAAVADGETPGVVVEVAHQGRVVYRKAFGMRALRPTPEAMTVDTIFDLASLTKCVATATAVMQLEEQGRIRLNDPVAKYLPEFGQNGKDQITIRELMTHFSGLRPDIDSHGTWHGRQAAYDQVMAEKPIHAPGARFVYSDINFETLGFLVERVTGETLDAYTLKHIYQPLGMTHTRFLPPSAWVPGIAPTAEDEQGQMLRGVVHDPTARRMDGVAGHAGVFSTADDLERFAQALLHGDEALGTGVLSRLTVEKMTQPAGPANSPDVRGLGWDIDSPYATNRGELLPVGSFGHTGFTGTSLWMDPVTDTVVIVLTNAVHLPHGGVVALRTKIATAVAATLRLTVTERQQVELARLTGYNESEFAARRVTVRNGQVRTGIDVLEADGFRELMPVGAAGLAESAGLAKSAGSAGSAHGEQVRVGLVTNQTGVDAAGRRTIDVLAAARGVKLVSIWSPEHGVAGKLDTTAIGDGRDERTGVPVLSAYGATEAERRPSAAALKDVDVIVYDMADAGVRFYTYESTLGYFLEAAAHAGKRLVVLDRPDPVGGVKVEGPVTDAGRESFVSYDRTPVRHGMTVGELATMWNAEKHLGARLSVVKMTGWQRGDWYDETGLGWVNPSPNLRSLTEATLYPGVGMIEGSNISVGRGTDTPFELVGAPWVDGVALARELNGRELEGVRFVPVRFVPTSSNYGGQQCGGVNLVVTERDQLDAVEIGLEVAAALERLNPAQFKVEALDGLMRNHATLEALKSGEDPRRIELDWQQAMEPFLAVRAKYLLY